MVIQQRQQPQQGQEQQEQQNGPEQRQLPRVLQHAMEDRIRILRLQRFNSLVGENLNILNEIYGRFLNRPDAFFLALPRNALQLELIRLEMCKARLLRRFFLNYPGERCLLAGLINLVTVASYQYLLVMNSAQFHRPYFFNWAGYYFRTLHVLNVPCRLLHLPPLAFDYNFICNHMQWDEYPLLIRYFIQHLMYCEERTCCGRHPLIHE